MAVLVAILQEVHDKEAVEGEKIFSVQVFFIIPIEQLVENQFCSATCGQVTTQLHPCLSHFQPL